MEIKILGENLTITESMETYLKGKFLNLPIPEKLQNVEFRVSLTKNTHLVRFNAHFNHKQHFIENKGSSFYEASDLLIDKIKRDLVKAKEQSHSYQKHSKVDWNSLPTQNPII